MVGISDVFPQAFPYVSSYARGRIHPAYWVLTLEVDHVLAHSRGGPGVDSNLISLHALCNTLKADTLVDELPAREPLVERGDWDGLLPLYAGIVAASEAHGTPHAAVGYHRRWLRLFGLQPIE